MRQDRECRQKMMQKFLGKSRETAGVGRSAWARVLGMVAMLATRVVAAQTPPGMPAIAQSAADAPVIIGILNGTIPVTIPQSESFGDPTGQIGSYQPGGVTTTANNAFFSSKITSNGRSCFTCHQPQNGWSITPATVLTQYQLTLGQSALFQPIDSANCPDNNANAKTYAAYRQARAQLFNHGNFRISINAPNPAGPAGGTTFNGSSPQWAMTVKSDPTGCENDSEYGLPNNLASVYRRPLPSANVLMLNPGNGPLPGFNVMWDAREPNLLQQFIDATEFHGQEPVTNPPTPEDQTEGVLFQQGIYTAQAYDNSALDLTGGDGSGALGGPVNFYDSRLAPAINQTQFGGCALAKGKTIGVWSQAATYPTNSFILDSNGNVEVASTGGVSNTTEPVWPETIASTTDDGTVVWTVVEVDGVCPALHPKETITSNQVTTPPLPATSAVDLAFDVYGPVGPATFITTLKQSKATVAQRQSIVRGEAIFNTRQFTITNVSGLNDVTVNPRPGQTCSTCHNNTNAGGDAFFTPKHTGIGDNSIPACSSKVTTNCTTLPPATDFPLFAFYCPTGSITYFSNPVTSANCSKIPNYNSGTCDEFDTTDPGVGLVTGQCADLGKMKVPLLRGLAARAPYFHGGEAANLQALVAFYNARFNIGLSAQEQQDLVNFMNSL